MGTYSASKSAVHSLMQGLRSELKEQHVLVATVYPGPVDTDMLTGFEIEKASPTSVAINIVNGIKEGAEEYFLTRCQKIWDYYICLRRKNYNNSFQHFKTEPL